MFKRFFNPNPNNQIVYENYDLKRLETMLNELKRQLNDLNKRINKLEQILGVVDNQKYYY